MEIFLIAIATFEVVLALVAAPKSSESEDGGHDTCAS